MIYLILSNSYSNYIIYRITIYNTNDIRFYLILLKLLNLEYKNLFNEVTIVYICMYIYVYNYYIISIVCVKIHFQLIFR